MTIALLSIKILQPHYFELVRTNPQRQIPSCCLAAQSYLTLVDSCLQKFIKILINRNE